MSLQPNAPFKEDFEDYSVQASLECLRLDRGIRVQEGSKNSRNERRKKSKRKGNSKGLMVGRKEREKKKGENTKHEKGLFKVYFDLSSCKNQSSPIFFLNHFFRLLSEARKTSCLSFQVKIYLWFIL